MLKRLFFIVLLSFVFVLFRVFCILLFILLLCIVLSYSFFLPPLLFSSLYVCLLCSFCTVLSFLSKLFSFSFFLLFVTLLFVSLFFPFFCTLVLSFLREMFSISSSLLLFGTLMDEGEKLMGWIRCGTEGNRKKEGGIGNGRGTDRGGGKPATSYSIFLSYIPSSSLSKCVYSEQCVEGQMVKVVLKLPCP